MHDEEQTIAEVIGLLGQAIRALDEVREIKTPVVQRAAFDAAKGHATYLIRTADKQLGLS